MPFMQTHASVAHSCSYLTGCARVVPVCLSPSGSGVGVLPPMRLKDFEQQQQQHSPGALAEVLKPSTCAVLNGFLSELTVTENITVE